MPWAESRQHQQRPLPAIADLSGYSLSPDGKSFATSASHPTGDIWMLEGFERPGWRRWWEGIRK